MSERKLLVTLVIVAVVALSASVVFAEEIIFQNGQTEAVYNGGGQVFFTLNRPYFITRIVTYHWNGGSGANPGKISLYHLVTPDTGRHKGTWDANPSNDAAPPSGRTQPPYLYWHIWPRIQLDAGTYIIGDSDPATWATSSQTKGQGHCIIYGEAR